MCVHRLLFLRDSSIRWTGSLPLPRSSHCKASPAALLRAVRTALEILDIFTAIHAEGTTIMLVTHDAKVAAQSERILFPGDGKIVSEISFPRENGMNLEQRMQLVSRRMQEIEI